MRPLVEAGKVYIALPPLYKVSKGVGKKEVMAYAWTDEELDLAIKKNWQRLHYPALQRFR